MHTMKRIFVSLLIIAGLAFLYSVKSFTLPIFSANAVAELRAIEVNGDRQWLLIRGRDRSMPVLLFVHGGPGMPAMYLAHDFQSELEQHFVIAHWDQRGAGKSFNDNINPATLTIGQLLADTDVIVDHLRQTFAKEKIWLVGHSHGAYLGALYARDHPEKVRAFIGVGQVADFERERPLQDAFLRSQLPALGLPADTDISDANREDLLFKTGSELYGETSFMPLIYSGLLATEYSLFDIRNVAKGSSFSSAHMQYDRSRNLITDTSEFAVPVAILMGKHDMTTPYPLAREYFEAIDAPDKRWIEFEDAAHFPFFENPKEFTEVMVALKQDWPD